jgi:glutamate/tyrosine decarboxylase-like PLP-dependent enzyme
MVEHLIPDKLWIYWCPNCGAITQSKWKFHVSPTGHNCSGKTTRILYAPIINVRRVIGDAAAEYAAIGDAPNVLLSIAMYQALNKIEEAYDIYDNTD